MTSYLPPLFLNLGYGPEKKGGGERKKKKKKKKRERFRLFCYPPKIN